MKSSGDRKREREIARMEKRAAKLARRRERALGSPASAALDAEALEPRVRGSDNAGTS